ncbi:WxL domain surface cell wall-binding [Pilibacter termitis]|uniref:WxL domain surface cell wall-binding n=1 Tax=Pilibacter termitis TaxID=263852 RepID=A0A1T4LFW3_9ENTE|nr:WxL domain-containing protein [Pilibacter termitis]SJZ53384.1 WxL domain surface cell wall-binding [Pilibacter termitis]
MRKLTLITGIALCAVALQTGMNVSALGTAEDTTGKVELKKDTTTNVVVPPSTGGGNTGGGTVSPSKLEFAEVPTEILFNKKITSADQIAPLVTFTAVRGKDAQGNVTTGNQRVGVYDGRLLVDGINWKVSAKATEFKTANGNAKLTGAKIKLKDVKLTSQDTSAALSFKTASKDFVISTNNTSADFFGTKDSTSQAKQFSYAEWDPEKVELEVAGNQLVEGTFSSTISWNLSDTAIN